MNHNVTIIEKSCIYDQEDEFDLLLRKGHEFIKLLFGSSGKSKESKCVLLDDAVTRDPGEEYNIVNGLICEILTREASGNEFIELLMYVQRDGYVHAVRQLNRLAHFLYPRMTRTSQHQLVWLVSQLLSLNVKGVDEACMSLERQIVSGNLAERNVRLLSSLLSVFEEPTNQRIFASNDDFLAVTLYTYLRICSDLFGNPEYSVLLSRIVSFCMQIITKYGYIVAKIGREFVRLLQNVSGIDVFRRLFIDLLTNPQKINESIRSIHDILDTPTPKAYIRSRVTPQMEEYFFFLFEHAKSRNYRRYHHWFCNKFLMKSSSNESVVSDMIRFICCCIHPPNHILKSDILQRWTIIGGLYKRLKSENIRAQAKLSLFFDWFFFRANRDSIMNIEPGCLLIHHSVEKYSEMTAEYLEFIFLCIDNLFIPLKSHMQEAVRSSLNQLLDLGVIYSFKPVLECSAIHDDIRQHLSSFLDDHSVSVTNVVTSPSSPSLSRGFQSSNKTTQQGQGEDLSCLDLSPNSVDLPDKKSSNQMDVERIDRNPVEVSPPHNHNPDAVSHVHAIPIDFEQNCADLKPFSPTSTNTSISKGKLSSPTKITRISEGKMSSPTKISKGKGKGKSVDFPFLPMQKNLYPEGSSFHKYFGPLLGIFAAELSPSLMTKIIKTFIEIRDIDVIQLASFFCNFISFGSLAPEDLVFWGKAGRYKWKHVIFQMVLISYNQGLSADYSRLMTLVHYICRARPSFGLQFLFFLCCAPFADDVRLALGIFLDPEDVGKDCYLRNESPLGKFYANNPTQVIGSGKNMTEIDAIVCVLKFVWKKLRYVRNDEEKDLEFQTPGLCKPKSILFPYFNLLMLLSKSMSTNPKDLIAADLTLCVDQICTENIFSNLVPLIFREIPFICRGNSNLIHLILENIFPKVLNKILFCTSLDIFHFVGPKYGEIACSSLKWHILEQQSLWKIICVENSWDNEQVKIIANVLSKNRNHPGLFAGFHDFLILQKPSLNILETVMAFPYELRKLCALVLTFWIRFSPRHLCASFSLLLQSLTRDLSPLSEVSNTANLIFSNLLFWKTVTKPKSAFYVDNVSLRDKMEFLIKKHSLWDEFQDLICDKNQF